MQCSTGTIHQNEEVWNIKISYMMYRNEKYPFSVEGESERKGGFDSPGSFDDKCKKMEAESHK